MPLTLSDSNEVTIELIKNGFGWTLSRPTTMLQTKTPVGEILVRPMPKPQLNRRLYLMYRDGEHSEEAKPIQQICRKILLSSVLFELAAIAPWVRFELLIPTKDGLGEESLDATLA